MITTGASSIGKIVASVLGTAVIAAVGAALFYRDKNLSRR